jgi:RNA methyltransferase, TrmH family
MLSTAQTKYLRSLSVKKYRTEHQQFLVEGEKMVAELLRFAPDTAVSIYALADWAAQNPDLAQRFAEKTTVVTAAELEKISTLQTPNAVLALAQMPRTVPPVGLPAQDLCLYLDGLQDPGNLGTILRIADWYGIPAVFASPDTVDFYSPKVVQASMGALFRVACQALDLSALTSANAGLPVIGAVLDGEPVRQVPSPTGGLLVIGNEGRGIRPEAMAQLTQGVSIPRHPRGGAESLNAAVATGILVAFLRG